MSAAADTSSNSNDEKNIVFISYADEDVQHAARLYEILETAGLKPWMKNRSLLAGQNKNIEIRKAIENSKYFIALFSSTSVEERGYIQKELKFALDVLDKLPEGKVFILPIKLDKCEIPYETLRDIESADLFPNWNQGLDKILRSLNVDEQKIKNVQDSINLSPSSLHVSEDVNSISILIKKGRTMIRHNKYVEAVNSFDKALAIDPKNTKALNGKGDALRHLQRYDDANYVFDRAIAIDATVADVLKNKGLVLLDLDKFRKAIEYFDKALAIDPEHPRALRGKGAALSKLGNHSEALEYFDKALAIDPYYVGALINKGAALSKLGNHSEALEYFDKALAIDPDNFDALNDKEDTLRKLRSMKAR
jgi:tetratricopeptide (TPR) repeat protein